VYRPGRRVGLFAVMTVCAAGLFLASAAHGAGAQRPRAQAPAPSAATPAPRAPAPAVPNNALYRKDCRRCHGADGKGLKRNRLSERPDFTDADWQASRGDADLQVSILEGKGTHMPAFADSIREEDARQLVSYIRNLGGRTQARKAAPSEFERQFRKLEAEMQKLMRQFEEAATPPGNAVEVKASRAGRRPRPAEDSPQAVPLRTGHGG
jgi:mono/diheme cytochrome c family protein